MTRAMSLTQSRLLNEPVPNLWESDLDILLNRLQRRSEERGWHLPHYAYEDIEKQWSEHHGPLSPTAILVSLYGGLYYNWSEALEWIKDEAAARGLGLNTDFTLKPNNLSFYPGSETELYTVGCKVAELDLAKHWQSGGGVKFSDVRNQYQRWPGLEVAWLLALNPGYMMAMDNEQVPYVTAPGLQVGNAGLPAFGRGNTGIFVYGATTENPRVGSIPTYR